MSHDRRGRWDKIKRESRAAPDREIRYDPPFHPCSVKQSHVLRSYGFMAGIIDAALANEIISAIASNSWNLSTETKQKYARYRTVTRQHLPSANPDSHLIPTGLK